MTKTKKATAARKTSSSAPRRQTKKLLRGAAAKELFRVSPATKKRVRGSLPIAAAIVVGGGAIGAAIAIRRQLRDVARAVGDVGATGWKSIAAAVPMNRWLVDMGLRRKPLWLRALPAAGIVGGLLATGAAAFFFAPRGENARQVVIDPLANRMDAEERFGSLDSSSAPVSANSVSDHEVASHGHS
jgi:hypothetical protein